MKSVYSCLVVVATACALASCGQGAKGEYQTKACSIMRIDHVCRVTSAPGQVTIRLSNSSQVERTYVFTKDSSGWWRDQEGFSWKRSTHDGYTIWSGGEEYCSRPGLCRGTALSIFE